MELYEAYLRHPHISTDSRQATRGTLFFALRGDSFDGNRYAASALEAGAAAAVLDNSEVYETLTEEQRSRCYLVPDTLEALQQLAAYHRRQLGIPIFAITGSNGKTTTKELTYRVLSCRFHTYATHGNLNNHIGASVDAAVDGPARPSSGSSKWERATAERSPCSVRSHNPISG